MNSEVNLEYFYLFNYIGIKQDIEEFLKIIINKHSFNRTSRNIAYKLLFVIVLLINYYRLAFFKQVAYEIAFNINSNKKNQ